MKKIIGIIAAVAMAASVFAADVSAKVKLDGELFKFDGASGNISALKIQHNDNESWNPALSFAFNSDKVGASFGYYIGSWQQNGSWNWGYGGAVKDWKIWFKPIDMLKITVGDYSTNLNQEHITWSKTDSGSKGDQGFGLELYPIDGLSFTLALTPGWGNNWFSLPKDGDIAISNTYFKVQYGADFGTINAMIRGAETFKKLDFGVGYANNFSGINVFVNVLGYVNDGFEKVRIEPYADAGMGSLWWGIWVPVDIGIKEGVGTTVGTIAKISYNLGGPTVYLYIEEGNFLADSFAITIKPGITGNLGAMGWEVAAQFDIAEKVTVTVPVNFTVNF